MAGSDDGATAPAVELALRGYGDDHFLLLLDADSNVLGAQSIDVSPTIEAAPLDDGPGQHLEHIPSSFAFRLPRPAGLDRIVIVNEGGIIAELAPGGAEPTISALDVEMNGDVASVTWDAHDDGDPLSAIVRFGPEGARHILTATAPTEVQGDGSATIDLPDRAPHAVIFSPAGGTTRSAGQLVLLDGMAIDAEDGDDVKVSWISDVDGELGTAPMLGRHDLSAGAHVITLTQLTGPATGRA